jgi:hypothetical protein
MLHLVKDSTNKVTLTLYELSALGTYSYRIEFTHDESKEKYEFLLGEELSLYIERYNLYDIVIPDDIDFKDIGDYSYEVYELPEESSEEPLLVEWGRMTLTGGEPIIKNTYTPEIERKIYER